jgi:hypothetical protein
MVVRKERRLPMKGDVAVKVGDRLKASDVVAGTYLPGKIEPLNLVHKLGCLPNEVAEYLRVKEGDKLKKGDILAESKGFLGIKFFKTVVPSPIDGTVEAVSVVTGQMMLRGPDIPVQVDAYFDSAVVEVTAQEGCVVETTGSFIQGIFGVGGERRGEIKVVTTDNSQELTKELITPECKGKIIIGGSYVSFEAFEKAKDLGVKGIVVGGFDDSDLKCILGFDLGVAITGHEDIPITLIVTEGFGRIKMADRTFKLLKMREGLVASINGATQIRAGVMRPEIIIPIAGASVSDSDSSMHAEGLLKIGSVIRAIREPFFGKIGRVTALPPELTQVESETWVRILEAEFEDGTKGRLPRANVELIGN